MLKGNPSFRDHSLRHHTPDTGSLPALHICHVCAGWNCRCGLQTLWELLLNLNHRYSPWSLAPTLSICVCHACWLPSGRWPLWALARCMAQAHPSLGSLLSCSFKLPPLFLSSPFTWASRQTDLIKALDTRWTPVFGETYRKTVLAYLNQRTCWSSLAIPSSHSWPATRTASIPGHKTHAVFI